MCIHPCYSLAALDYDIMIKDSSYKVLLVLSHTLMENNVIKRTIILKVILLNRFAIFLHDFFVDFIALFQDQYHSFCIFMM